MKNRDITNTKKSRAYLKSLMKKEGITKEAMLKELKTSGRHSEPEFDRAIAIKEEGRHSKKSQGIVKGTPETIEDVALNPEYSSM